MKKKIIVIVIVLVIAILLIPIPMKLRDGGSTEYKALLYSVTKYHQLAPVEENGEKEYLEGVSIKILGKEVFNNKEKAIVENNESIIDNENNTEIEKVENTSNSECVITFDGITNISALDKFLDNVDRYNKNPISSEIKFVNYTIEGDEVVTTLKYDKDNDTLTVIRDYTKDRYGSQQIVTDIFKKGEFDLVKRIRDEYIDINLIVGKNESEEIMICAYNKDSEKNKDIDRVKVKDVLSKSNEFDINKLVKYNGTLYAKSNAVIDYAGNPDALIGTINKLIGEEYLPTLNGETNDEELLNAKVSEANEKIMVLYYNNVYVLYQAVNVKI